MLSGRGCGPGGHCFFWFMVKLLVIKLHVLGNANCYYEEILYVAEKNVVSFEESPSP